MPTMFRTTKHNSKIEAFEVVKVTASTVTYRETWAGTQRDVRNKRATDWHQWHDTWEEAHDCLLKQAEEKVLSSRLALERATGELGNIKGMRKPA